MPLTARAALWRAKRTPNDVILGGNGLTLTFGGRNTPHRKINMKLAPDEARNSNRIAVGERGGRPMKLVSGGERYALVMRSDKLDARAFQNWVTRDVLPGLRRTVGGARSINPHCWTEKPNCNLPKVILPAPTPLVRWLRRAGLKAIRLTVSGSKNRPCQDCRKSVLFRITLTLGGWSTDGVT